MNLDPTIGVFMDGLIAVLLLATIATGLFLNRRIERLRKSTADMGTMVGGFDKATARARAGIEGLRNALRDSGEQLQDQINVARDLRDDLRSLGAAGRADNERPLVAKGMPPKRAKSFATAEPKGMPGSDDYADDERPARVAQPKGDGRADVRNVARPQFAQRPQGAAVNRKPAVALAAAAATENASEVERELRELLRHVR